MRVIGDEALQAKRRRALEPRLRQHLGRLDILDVNYRKLDETEPQ